MALPDLIAKLERDAQGQVEAIAQRAEAEVRAIEAAARQELAEAAARIHAERQTVVQATFNRELSQARRRARADELDAQRALVARVLHRARALSVDASASPGYREAVAAHLEDALSYLEGVDVRLRCSAAMEPLLRPFAARRGVPIEIDPSVGPGFVAEARDGSVTIDNTLAARLARLDAQLAVHLLAEVRRGRT